MNAAVSRIDRRPTSVPRRRSLPLVPLLDDDGEQPEQGAPLPQRPRTRADCVGAPRPCPWVGCRHHLAIEVNPATGTIKLVYPDRDIDELPATCALDLAALGGLTLEEVGEVFNVTRERARQLEERAVAKLQRRRRVLGLVDPSEDA